MARFSLLARSLVLVLLSVSPARAVAPRKPSLQWTRSDAAARCIDPRTLAARVEALMGPVFLAPAVADYAIEGHIDARRRGLYLVRLSVTDAKGTPQGDRVIELAAPDCRALDNTLVFLIALTIDPDLELDGLLPDASLEGVAPEEALLAELTEQPPAPQISPSPEPVPTSPPAPSPPPTAPAPRRAWRAPGTLELSAGAFVARRELPDTSAGVLLGLGWRAAQGLALRAQLRAHSLLTPYVLADTGRVRVQAIAPALLVCTGPRWGVLELSACLGPEAAVLRARGVGLASNASTVLTSWGALAQLDLRAAVSARISLLAQGFVRVAFEPKRFVYMQNFETLEAFTLQGVGGGTSFGLAYRF